MLIVVGGCIELYEPVIEADVFDILVVDGFINATTNSAQVDISYAQHTNDTGERTTESGATVTISSSDGEVLNLTESEPGRYNITAITPKFDVTYRLNIRTASSREIESGEIQLQRTPPIDSVTWRLSNDEDGLIVQVNTHNNDPKASRRYSWSFTETYEYTAKYYSGFKKENKFPVPRKDEDLIYKCWATENSGRILVGNTFALASNTITGYNLTTIRKGSRKLGLRYSTLVRQRCVDSAEYRFMEDIRKTTEQLGGLFDPMPFGVIGNLKEVNDTRTPVLGYFSGGEVTEVRKFIDFNELPLQLQVRPDFPGCQPETTCPVGVVGFSCLTVEDVAISPSVFVTMITDPRGTASAFTYVEEQCADCRKYGGGVTKRPDFW